MLNNQELNTIQQQIDILQAFLNEEKIEVRQYDTGIWMRKVGLQFNFIDCEYRVKPKPETVPLDFSDAENLVGTIVKNKKQEFYI